MEEYAWSASVFHNDLFTAETLESTVDARAPPTNNSVTAERTATAPPEIGSVAGILVAYSQGPVNVQENPNHNFSQTYTDFTLDSSTALSHAMFRQISHSACQLGSRLRRLERSTATRTFPTTIRPLERGRDRTYRPRAPEPDMLIDQVCDEMGQDIPHM